jgi:predicted Zn-ribbon and HTH transcriptional regulator
MSILRRWSLVAGGDAGWMERRKNGEYVEHSQAAELEQENAELRNSLDEASANTQHLLDTCVPVHELTALRDENAELREANRTLAHQLERRAGGRDALTLHLQDENVTLRQAQQTLLSRCPSCGGMNTSERLRPTGPCPHCRWVRDALALPVAAQKIGESLGLSENLAVVPPVGTPSTCPECGPIGVIDDDGDCRACGVRVTPVGALTSDAAKE